MSKRTAVGGTNSLISIFLRSLIMNSCGSHFCKFVPLLRVTGVLGRLHRLGWLAGLGVFFLRILIRRLSAMRGHARFCVYARFWHERWRFLADGLCNRVGFHGVFLT